jgi:hypothetical protein
MEKARSSFLFSALLVIVLNAACFAGDTPCTPHFSAAQKWLGSDAAYSIPLPEGRSVWIFGDTLFGTERKLAGPEPVMVRNSIGISTCKDGKFDIDYVIRKSGNGKALDFFQARNRSTWYWALDGFYHDKSLYVTLLCLRDKPVTVADPIGFETCGSDLAKISDLDADPQDWTMEYFPLVPDGVKAYPSATAVVDGEFVYIFALYENATRPLLVTRIPLTGLKDPQKNLRYLAKDGSWKPGLVPADAKPVMDDGVTELSIRYHPEMKKWVAIMMDPKLTGKIILRTASAMTGPWSEAKAIYSVPELKKDAPGYDSDTFCYAGKEHPEFENSDLLFTYACNTMKVPKLLEKLDLYYPQTVRMEMPKN